MDFSKIFESVLAILYRFIPQFNRILTFLFSSYFILDSSYKNSIRLWILRISNSDFIFNFNSILKSFGIETFLPFISLLILITIVFYFDITSIQIGRLLPPYLSYNTAKILTRHFSRENMIELWRINPKLTSIYKINEYLDIEVNKNLINPNFRNAFNFQQSQFNYETWMSFFQFLFFWAILLPVFFPPVQNPQDISSNEIVLFIIFICWIYFMQKHIGSTKWFCIWKMYSVLDLNQGNKNKHTIRNEDDLPDFLKVEKWIQEDRWRKKLPTVTIQIVPFDFFERLKDMAVALFDFLDQLPFFKVPEYFKVWQFVEHFKRQEDKDSLPLPSQSAIDYIQKQLYSETAQKVLDVPDNLKENYKFFLSNVRGSGIIKLVPNGRYTGLIDLSGDGSSYSFSSYRHDLDYLCDISLTIGAKEFACIKQGFVLDIGDIDLPKTKYATSTFIEKINASEISKLEKIIKFVAPLNESEFYKIYQEQSLSSFAKAKAVVNHAYLLRVFRYNYENPKRENIVNDIIVIFRAVEQLQDGSFILLWRLLEGSNFGIR